jgi:opacity protein-like surface antigen
MKTLTALILTLAVFAGTAQAADYTNPAIATRAGTMVTFTNPTAASTYGYLYYETAATGVTFTTTNPNAMLATNPHATYLRIRVGAKWVYRWVNTGYDISVRVDPNTTVTVIASAP